MSCYGALCAGWPAATGEDQVRSGGRVTNAGSKGKWNGSGCSRYGCSRPMRAVAVALISILYFQGLSRGKWMPIIGSLLGKGSEGGCYERERGRGMTR